MQMSTNKLIVGLASLFVLFLVVASIISIRHGGFMIPGLAPEIYTPNKKVELYVNKVTSIHEAIPYRYHDLPVCTPKQIQQKSENLGEIITGNRIEASLYDLQFKVDKNCQQLCEKDVTKDDIAKLKDLIKEEYIVHWQLDGLPAASKAILQQTLEEVLEIGFYLGQYQNTPGKESYILNNHVSIKVHYHKHTPQVKTDYTSEVITMPETEPKAEKEEYNIVLFEVAPESKDKICGTNQQQLVLSDDLNKIAYSYSVTWVESKTDWAHRWDDYLKSQGEGQIHWFSIVNSLMIVLFLSGMVAMIMARTVRRDLLRYMEEDQDEVEETGWKLVRADVFRPPQFPSLFSVLVGSGVQILCMCVVTMVFAVLGFLAPNNSGSLATAVLVLYVWMGLPAGYAASRIYLMFNGEKKNYNTLMTALLFPGTVFAIVFVLNSLLWYKHSSGAFPFTTMLALMALWTCISVPLCFLGSRLAYRKAPPTHPGTVNHIPRQIPTQHWYMNPITSILVGGILPFGAVFIELFFILSSIWLHLFYFLFGFLFLVFLILIITCAEISVVICYFQLCAEDWHWWWRSFLTSGASALYMFLYSIFYYATRLEVDGFIPSVLYFGYSIILCLFFFALTGTIGFYSCYWFVKRIYSAIHQD